MDRMAVCYFCGDVVEGPDPTPLLPPALRGSGGGPTLDLCVDCREKYAAVRRAVEAAAGEGGRATESGGPASAVDATDDDAGPAGDEGVATAEGSGTGGDEGEPASTDREPADEEGTDAAATDPSESSAADVSVSRADLRRVMRLLENRELPVDRAEIASVAASAYEVPEPTAQAIIDAAAEKGLLALEDGAVVEAG